MGPGERERSVAGPCTQKARLSPAALIWPWTFLRLRSVLSGGGNFSAHHPFVLDAVPHARGQSDAKDPNICGRCIKETG